MSRRKKSAEQAPLAMPMGDPARGEDPTKPSKAAFMEPPPPSVHDAPDAAAAVGFYPRATQVERIAALATARADGEREGTIAAMAECAALARDWNVGNDETRLGRRIASDILAELNRRYHGDPRVAHHLKMRGLA